MIAREALGVVEAAVAADGCAAVVKAQGRVIRAPVVVAGANDERAVADAFQGAREALARVVARELCLGQGPMTIGGDTSSGSGRPSTMNRRK